MICFDPYSLMRNILKIKYHNCYPSSDACYSNKNVSDEDKSSSTDFGVPSTAIYAKNQFNQIDISIASINLHLKLTVLPVKIISTALKLKQDL